MVIAEGYNKIVLVQEFQQVVCQKKTKKHIMIFNKILFFAGTDSEKIEVFILSRTSITCKARVVCDAIFENSDYCLQS